MKNLMKSILFFVGIFSLTFSFVSCETDSESETPTYYTVSFNSDGGSFVTAQTVEAGKTATKPTAPTKSGYSFNSWYNGSSAFDFATPIKANLTLVAHWNETKNETPNSDDSNNSGNSDNSNSGSDSNNPSPTIYTVTFNANAEDSQGETQSISAESGKSVTLTANAFTRDGYAFQSWNTNADGTGTEYANGAEITLSENLTLYAQWKLIPKNSFTVTFDTDGGSTVDQQIVEEGETAIQPTNPTKMAYNFVAWLNGDSEFDFSTPISENVTLKAKWSESIIHLSLKTPNDDATITLTKDSAPILINATSTDAITKVVWKKGNENAQSEANALLEDDFANTITLDGSGSTTFTVSENGFYDVAVKNASGAVTSEQIQVKTIDRTAPAEVENLSSSYSATNHTVTLTWNAPADTGDEYDSPFAYVTISYKIAGSSEETKVQETVTKGIGKAEIANINTDNSAEDYVFTVRSVDEVGNVSEGGETKTSVVDYGAMIRALTKDSTIKVTGVLTEEILKDIASAIGSISYRNDSEKVYVYLDLGEATGMTDLPDSIFYPNIVLKQLKGITLPTCLKKIGDKAFLWCSNLETVVLPDGLTTIGRVAFRACRKLTNITLPKTVESIGAGAFWESGIKTIIIPDKVTEIKAYTLACSNLSEVVIGESVSSIDETAFHNCSEYTLTNVTFKGNHTWFCSKNSLTPEEFKNYLPNIAVSSSGHIYASYNDKYIDHCDFSSETEEERASNAKMLLTMYDEQNHKYYYYYNELYAE